MTWRVPPFDRAIAELEVYVRATYAPIGIVVAGSIVRGEAGPNSDLDVFVVHDQPWRRREQRWVEGVPVELFVNPPQQVRRYFVNGHADGCPDTAHMFATGEPLEPVHPVIRDLVAEARDWLARSLEPAPDQLESLRYAAVDLLDDARDIIACDPVATSLLLADAVRQIIAYAFWKQRQFQPRRKDAVTALAAIDPAAAELVRRWSRSSGAEALAAAGALARHVLDADAFYAWTSVREPIAER